MATAKKKRVKKKSAEFLRRSQAAKKGWRTRKANEVKTKLKKKVQRNKKKITNAQRGKPKRQRKVIPTLDLADKSRTELEEIIRQQRAEIESLEMTKDWVDAMPPEFLHQDGTIALEPSRLRHMGKATHEMMRMLRKAARDGENELQRVAIVIANQFNVTVREVYTLHFSP